MESQSKVRGGGTITALLFKPRNVQVRLPPRKRAHAPQPRACRMRVAIAHPSVCGMTPVGARSVRCSCRPVVWLSQLQLPPTTRRTRLRA